VFFCKQRFIRTRRTISLESLLVDLDIKRTVQRNLFDNKRQGIPIQQVV